MSLARLTMLTMIAVILPACASTAAAQSLDFNFYKARVEPIFLKKRPTHARCVACHSTKENGSALRLEPLSPGSKTWTVEQSRKNFESVARLVTPGDPEKSRLLKHPLAEEAGGDYFHGGGRQFASKNDPEWQTLAEWVRQAKK